MKFLVDQAVSSQVSRDLTGAGHDALHVREIGLGAANDETILRRAADEGRVVITQDTDFGTLLTLGGWQAPSVILLRLRDGRPETHSRAVLGSLSAVEAELREGVIVVLSDATLRIRKLHRG